METEGESFEEIVFVTLLGFSALNSMSLTAVVVMEEAMKEALMIVVVLYWMHTYIYKAKKNHMHVVK